MLKVGLFLCCWGFLAMGVGCAESNSAIDALPAASVAPVATADATEPALGKTAGNELELTPANTSIGFVGNHTGADPKPRHGSFQRFTGVAVVDGTLKSVMVDIETASLTTEIDKLTNHLKNADFFDVNQFPKATFKSTVIKDNGDGTVEITGDLTLLDNTHSVTFPATVSLEGGLVLKAGFEIDRTQWGLDYGPDQIEKQVPMTITIGG